MPLAGTRVLHPAMQAHHAPVAEGGMTAVVDLYDPSAPTSSTYDRATGQTVVVSAAPAYVGVRARVQHQQAGRERTAEAVAEDVLTPPYLVAVPYRYTADEGWIVHVRSCDDDPALGERRLTVRQVMYAAQRFQRDLFCDDE